MKPTRSILFDMHEAFEGARETSTDALDLYRVELHVLHMLEKIRGHANELAEPYESY